MFITYLVFVDHLLNTLMPYVYELTALGAELLCRHSTSRLVVTAHYTRDLGHNFGSRDHSFHRVEGLDG